jgi:hypothetical protein
VKGVAFLTKRQGLPVPPEHADDSPAYEVGQVVEVSDASARHFMNRGAAELVTEKARAFKAAEPAPEPAKAEPAKPDPVKK